MHKKIAYVHLGLEKCGSKSIQEALRNLVPSTSLVCDIRFDNAIENLIKKNNEVVYISDERLSWCDPFAMNSLQQLTEAGYTIKALAVFRNPLNFMRSIYLESLKWGEIKNFNDYFVENLHRLNYSSLNTTIEQMLPGQKYSHIWLSDNIVNDVLMEFNLPPLRPNLNIHFNAQLGLDYSEILLKINRLMDGVNIEGVQSREIIEKMDAVFRANDNIINKNRHDSTVINISIDMVSQAIISNMNSPMFAYGLGRSL